MNTYSQAGQDIWVLETLQNKKNGFFLDVGAYDGVKYSNSYILEKDYSWNGLMIEAHPCNFENIKKIRTSILAPYAISDENGTVIFEDDCGTGSKVSKGKGFEVPTITFEKLFELYDVPEIIDYISLDIEGYEYKSLTKFPFNKYKCRLLTVEHNLYVDGPTNKNNIRNILEQNGYTLEIENVSHQGLPFEDWYVNYNI